MLLKTIVSRVFQRIYKNGSEKWFRVLENNEEGVGENDLEYWKNSFGKYLEYWKKYFGEESSVL